MGVCVLRSAAGSKTSRSTLEPSGTLNTPLLLRLAFDPAAPRPLRRVRHPLLIAPPKCLHWGIPDPSSLHGTPEERLAKTRAVRDAIKAKIENWCAEMCSPALT